LKVQLVICCQQVFPLFISEFEDEFCGDGMPDAEQLYTLQLCHANSFSLFVGVLFGPAAIFFPKHASCST
jgi:hypothetical protein